jgi:hypothetical protein
VHGFPNAFGAPFGKIGLARAQTNVTNGINFYGSTRHVFTTHRDGAIYLSATATSVTIDTTSHRLSSALARKTLLGSI